MTAIQKNKIYLILSMMVILAFSHLGVWISSAGEIHVKAERMTVSHVEQWEKIAAGEKEGDLSVARTLITYPADALLHGISAGTRQLLGQSDRFHFNSVFDVLFKIAVVPNMVFAAIMTAEKSISGAGRRVICFVHNSDGKKENLFRIILKYGCL